MTKLQVSEAGSTNRVEVQVARMIVVMVMAFLVTWLPYAGMALAVIMDSSLNIDPIIATVPVYLAKSSTVYNPVIYIFMNRQVILHHAHVYTKRNFGVYNHSLLLTMCCVFPVSSICCSHRPVWVEPVGLRSTDV